MSGPRGLRLRGTGSTVWSVLAVLLLWAALIAPYHPPEVQPAALVRLPLEGLVLAGVLLALPVRARRWTAVAAGVVLALLCVLKALELGFHLAFMRPFDPLSDANYAGSAVDLLFSSVGTGWAVAALVATALLVVGLLIALPLAAVRVGAVVAAHRTAAVRLLGVLAVVWAGLAIPGVQAGGGHVASASSARLVAGQADQIAEGIREQRRFEEELATDPLAASGDVLAGDVLSGLGDKDVLIIFVESYGRYSVEGASSGPVLDALADGRRRLEAQGYSARSAFLTAPTFGGTSWLAHATLQSGLWIDDERSYRAFMASERTTLTGLFERTGRRTAVVIPSSESPWPEGERLYGFDTMYGTNDLAYTGPAFGYARVPDQVTLNTFGKQELEPEGRGPVMAEIDLVSSHSPWVPLPELVPWNELGDSSIFEDMSDERTRADVWGDTEALRSAYSDSLLYSLESLFGFVERFGDDDLVLIVLGDHQPASVVTGQGASHDVPVSVIAGDPAVIRRIDAWDWSAGLRPSPGAPVWPMDDFLPNFLEAYSE